MMKKLINTQYLIIYNKQIIGDTKVIKMSILLNTGFGFTTAVKS